MKKLLYCFGLLFALMLFVACSEEENPGCDIFDESIASIFQVDGSSYCIEWGAIRYDTRNGAPPALQIASIDNPSYPELQIGWRLEDSVIEFGVEYSDFVEEYSYLRFEDGSEYEIVSGSLIVAGSNYPNPSILKYYGSFDLIYADDEGVEKSVTGAFSLKL